MSPSTGGDLSGSLSSIFETGLSMSHTSGQQAPWILPPSSWQWFLCGAGEQDQVSCLCGGHDPPPSP